MKLMKLILFVLTWSHVSAAQYIQIDSTEVIKVNLSWRNHNRIGIVGERIKKAFYSSSLVCVEVEEETGQIFIQAVKPDCPSTSISIVSDSGVVQDLEVSFSDISSEIILLEHPSEIWESKNCNIHPLKSSAIAYLVENLIKDTIPDGYKSIEDNDHPVPLHNGLELRRTSRLVSDEQIVFVYRLKNVSCKDNSVTECQVNILDGDWVFLDRYRLKPQECALVLIGCAR